MVLIFLNRNELQKNYNATKTTFANTVGFYIFTK